ncbi:enolase 4 [Octopus bimaculoides]|nr:enolase 4 [Octopus bimaculoides]
MEFCTKLESALLVRESKDTDAKDLTNQLNVISRRLVKSYGPLKVLELLCEQQQREIFPNLYITSRILLTLPLYAYPVLDSDTQPSIQIDVYCTINGLEKLVTSVMTSSFNSQIWNMSKVSEIEIEENERERSIELAITYINGELNTKLNGLNPSESQFDVDTLLKDFFSDLQLEADKQPINRKVTDACISEDNAEADTDKDRRGSKQNKQSPNKKSTKGKCKSEIILPPDSPIKKWLSGTPALSAVSLAICITGAVLKNIPLHDHIFQLTDPPLEVSYLFLM